MEEANLPSTESDLKEKSMAPTAGTARKRITDEEPTPRPERSYDVQMRRPVSSDLLANASTPEVNKEMPKEESITGRIKMVFGLAMLAALASLAGQLQILGISDVLGFFGAMAALLVAVFVAIPQLRRNFRANF